jgi:hypothetical protein
MIFDTADYSYNKRNITFDMSKLGLSGKIKARDLWKKTDLGEFSGTEFSPEINYHGAGFYRLSK